VRGYFLENSGKKFTIEKAGLLGWYDADKPAEHYWGLNDVGDQDNDGWIRGHHEKWAEAIRKADQDFDFSKYDKNKDKVLSADELAILIIIPQNNPRGYHRAVVGKENPKQDLVVDGVKIPSMVETYIGATPSVGLVAHELSHILLGTADMYVDAFQPYAPGPYSLMDQSPRNPGHLDPFHKLKLGWLFPKIITDDLSAGTEVLFDVETGNEVLILYDPRRGNKEYFIVENRWGGSSYDRFLPHDGMAVWHVIEDPDVFQNLPKPSGVDDAKWREFQTWGWGRTAIRMIRPIYGPPYNTALWDGSLPATGYDLLSADPNPDHVTLQWADGRPSGFSIRSIPPAAAQMIVAIEYRETDV